MNKNQDFTICSICGKDFRILRVPGDKSEIPELVIENGKWKWICGNCRKMLKDNQIVIKKQEFYYDRNINKTRDMIGITFEIKKKPNFYLDIVLTGTQAASYEGNFREDPFKFLKRRGLEILLEKIEKEDHTSEIIDLSDEVRNKIHNL